MDLNHYLLINLSILFFINQIFILINFKEQFKKTKIFNFKEHLQFNNLFFSIKEYFSLILN